MLVQVLEQFMPPSQHALEPLNETESLFLSALAGSSDERINALVAEVFETREYQLITKRFGAYPRMVGTRVKLFVHVMVESYTECGLWVAIIQYLAWKRNVDMYTMEMFVEDFGTSIYSKEQMQTMWKMQEIGNTNMVDMVAAQVELLAHQGDEND